MHDIERLALLVGSFVSGVQAMQLRIAEDYVTQFGKLAKAANTLVVPANLSDIASMLTLATRVVNDAKEKA